MEEDLRAWLDRMFWSRVDQRAQSACWPWTGSVNKDTGYGTLDVRRQSRTVRWLAHRLAYTLHKGPIPDGLCVMHACDNRTCVNPAHLSVGTKAENSLDMHRKGRAIPQNSLKTHCVKGHPFSGANLILRDGGRRCRECEREGHRRFRARRAEGGT